MKELHKEIYNIFSTLSEAVTVIRKEKIIYANPAAQRMFGDEVLQGCAADFFNELLLDESTGDVSGMVTIKGEQLAATASDMDGCRVITVHPSQRREGAETETGMISSAGASIKSALAICQMSIGLLRGKVENTGDVKLIQYTAMLDKACHGIVRIVNNFSKLCGIDGEGKTLNESALDLVELCGDLVNTVDYLVRDKNITITWESSKDSIIYYGDGDKIERMLLNLLSNSLKYTPAGGKITLSIKTTNRGIVLQVRDNGRGIPSETLATVFHRYDGVRDTTDAMAGAGLGLSVVQQIAGLHGGSAVIESKLDIGTTVTVLLPFRKGQDDVLMDEKVQYNNDMSAFLTELCDVLSYKVYYAENQE